jgi:hypothetical protein
MFFYKGRNKSKILTHSGMRFRVQIIVDNFTVNFEVVY